MPEDRWTWLGTFMMGIKLARIAMNWLGSDDSEAPRCPVALAASRLRWPGYFSI